MLTFWYEGGYIRPTRKPRDPVNKVAIYKQIDPTYVDDIAE